MSASAHSLSGQWWQPDGWSLGECHFDTRVQSLRSSDELPPDTDEGGNTLYIPAPVDLHVHGGGGHDCMAGQAAIRGMLASAAATGTGALLATSVTAPFALISRFIEDVGQVMASPDQGSALLLGVHLEGPFINPDKLGAQPPHACALDSGQLESWLASGIVRVLTFAPEMDPDQTLLELCQRYDTRAQIGHTLCSWQQAQYALQCGCGVTHLYNAMSGMQARGGGAALAALASADYAEIITDGLHVDQVGFDAARRAIPHLYSVTDATAATAMPDGEYTLGSQMMIKSGQAVRLADGTLAGSCLTQQRSIEVLRAWGLDWHSIGNLCSARPARWIRVDRVGRIAPGSDASWLEIANGQLKACWLQGVRRALPAKA